MLAFCNRSDAQYIFIPKMGITRESIVPFGLLVPELARLEWNDLLR